MQNKSNQKSLTMLLTTLQGASILALLLGVLAALWLCALGVAGTGVGLGSFSITDRADAPEYAVLSMSVIGLLTVVLVSIFSILALIAFISMLDRLKHSRAFTVQNGAALGKIARMGRWASLTLFASSLLMGLASLLVGEADQALDAILFFGRVVWVIAFMYLGVSLACQALKELLERAKRLQDESDWTI